MTIKIIVECDLCHCQSDLMEYTSNLVVMKRIYESKRHATIEELFLCEECLNTCKAMILKRFNG